MPITCLFCKNFEKKLPKDVNAKKNRSYFLVNFNANHHTTQLGHFIISFVWALYPDSVTAESLYSEQPKEIPVIKRNSQ